MFFGLLFHSNMTIKNTHHGNTMESGGGILWLQFVNAHHLYVFLLVDELIT